MFRIMIKKNSIQFSLCISEIFSIFFFMKSFEAYAKKMYFVYDDW